MKILHTISAFSFFILFLMFSSCGDHSNSKSSGSGASKGGSLSANAGPDVTIALGEEALLDGTASAPQTDIQRYYWLKISGPNLVFQQDASTQFLTPTEVGTYVFRLFIFSADGRSDIDDMTMIVEGQKPVANAGLDQNVVINTTATLDGSASEIRSSGVLNYVWTPVSFPVGDKPSLVQNTSKTTFIPKSIGEYVFSLVVSTGDFTSDPDFVTINSTNVLPVANAGPDRSVFINNLVNIDGSKSTYPSNSVPLFIWEQLSGPVTVSLINEQSLLPSFFAEAKGTYIFGLSLRVNGVSSNRDTVTVVVLDDTDKNIPIANPGPDQNGYLNEVLELDGTKSSSPNNTPLVYTWALTGGDASNINLSNLNSPKVSLIATKVGTYQISLTVYDGSFSSASTIVLVNIFDRSDTNLPPQFFEPVTSISVRIGEPIMVDIGAIDYEGSPLNFKSTVQVPKDVNYRLDTALDPILTFKPNLEINNNQTFTFTSSAFDGISQNTRLIQVKLLSHLLGRNDSRTAIIGRVTDVQGTPLQNATVNCGISFDITDKNGRFSITRVPDGANVPVIIDGRNAYTQVESTEVGRTSIYELETFTFAVTPFVNNIFERDITLYKVFQKDLVPTSRDKTTEVTPFDEENMKNFKLTIPASSPMGITGAFTSSIAAIEIDKALAAAEWNNYFNPTLLMKIRPHHVTYRIPAPITVPNPGKLPANTIATLWKFDSAKNKLIPINDIKAQGDVLKTENGGLTENGYLFTALSVSGTIRSSKDKLTIAPSNLVEIDLLLKEAIELKKKIATVIAQDKMSTSLGAMSLLAGFNYAYTNGSLTNNSLANITYQRLKSKFSKGSDLSAEINKAVEIGDEINALITPFDLRLSNFLKIIKRDAILTAQVNSLRGLLGNNGFDINNDAEVLQIRDVTAKRKAQVALITNQLAQINFTNETFTEISAAKIQEPVAISAKLYEKAHPYNDVLLRMDDIITNITGILESHTQINDTAMMTVLQVINAAGGVDEVISIKTIGNLTYIGNLDSRTDLLGKTVRVATYAKNRNKIGLSRKIILGKESATDLDVFIDSDAQLVVYEQSEEALTQFPASLQITKADKSVFLKALNANTFAEIPAGAFQAEAISKRNKTTLLPFTISPKKTHFIRFGQVDVNTVENILYQKESLVFFNQTLGLTYDKIELNDLVILPIGTYSVRSATSGSNDFWSGTVTINLGDTKRPFGAFQYATFSPSEAYDIGYQVIAANGSIAYTNVKIGNSVALLPGNYNLKAIATNTTVVAHTTPFLVKLEEEVNPFATIIVDTFTTFPFTYSTTHKLEFLRNDVVLFTNLTPGKELIVLPGKYYMRVVGMPTKMDYEIKIAQGDTLAVMGLVRFTEPTKKYNILQNDNLIYQDVGAGKDVILTPGLYTIDAVEEDGIPPQTFNVVFDSTFTYPDDTIIPK
jgi:hypothetical protein